MDAERLFQIVDAYPILTNLASYLSTIDLLYLSLTCRKLRSYIYPSQSIFKALSRTSLCDGHGLAVRKAWRARFHDLRDYSDSPIEDRVFHLDCDVGDTLPCRKCGINVCEECRFYPRGNVVGERRRPHLNAHGQSANIMCLCPECDERMEDEVRGRFLNELCDCDAYLRWICYKCVREEEASTSKYYKDHTVFEGGAETTKCMHDDQFTLDFYCICGGEVPDETAPRCTWCRRRHLHESQWPFERQRLQSDSTWYVPERFLRGPDGRPLALRAGDLDRLCRFPLPRLTAAEVKALKEKWKQEQTTS